MNLFLIYVCDEFKNRDSMKLLCEITEDKLSTTLFDLILSGIGEVRTLDIYKGTPINENEIVKLSDKDVNGKEIDSIKLNKFITNSDINKLNTFIKYLYIQKKHYI